MASLMEKLFDTMPLAGVEGALLETMGSKGELKKATAGQLALHLASHREPPAVKVSRERPNTGRLRALLNDTIFDWSAQPIWGYEASAGDPTRVKRVTCRVRNDDFNNYVVAEEIEWGHAAVDTPEAWTPDVEVAIGNTVHKLPLSNRYHLVSFTTKNGYNNPQQSRWLWPLYARHDEALLHVFMYDILFGPPDAPTREPRGPSDPDHPNADELRSFRDRCQRINGARPDDETPLAETLFSDNLWTADGPSAPPTGTVPENVDLSLRLVRVIVACSLTLCREHDDFQPGRPMGVGRLYPHVMVVSTSDLDRVEAGVRVTRPAQTTVLDGDHCGCGEMLPDIGSLLVTDSNKAGMVEWSVAGLVPLIYLANLFNYYVVDPALDDELRGKALPIMRSSKATPRNDVGFVDRDCSDIRFVDRGVLRAENQHRVAKLPRQGYFDNVHLAPKMRVTDQFDVVELYNPMRGTFVHADFKSYAEWKMDKVTMAPFCAHDCLHIHWRWSDSDNYEVGTFGWGANLPNKVVGAVMIPENQDAFLVLNSPRQVTYLAQARAAKADRWQPFFHHGAGYGLSVGPAVMLAQEQASLFDGVKFYRKRKSLGVIPMYDDVRPQWALFYWRLRYTFEARTSTKPDGTVSQSLVVKERFSFHARKKALDL